MQLFGRHKEKDALTRILARSGQSRPTLTLISGEAGAGKSSLVRFLEPVVEQTAGLFIEVACQPDWSSEFLFSSALCKALEPLENAVEGISSKLKLVPTWSAQEQSLAFQRQCCEALLRLQELAGPVVLFIDDVQWADFQTSDLITFLVRERSLAPIHLWIGSRSQECPPGLWQALVQLSDLHLELEGLAVADVESFVRAHLALPDEDVHTLAQQIHSQSGGHALQVSTALGLMAAGEMEAHSFDLPTLLLKSLDRLTPEEFDLLGRAACLGKSFPLSMLASLLSVPLVELQVQLLKFVDLGLLLGRGKRYEFRHDKLLEAVRQRWPSELAAQTHKAISELLVGDEATYVVGVEHLARSLEVLGEQEKRQFSTMALRAAAMARDSGALARAFSLARNGARALQVWPATGEAIDESLSAAWSQHQDIASKLCLMAAESSAGVLNEEAWQLPTRLLLRFSDDSMTRARTVVNQARALARSNRHREVVEVCEAFLRETPGYRAVSSGSLGVGLRLLNAYRKLLAHLKQGFHQLPYSRERYRRSIHELHILQRLSVVHVDLKSMPAYLAREMEEMLATGRSPENAPTLLALGAAVCCWLDRHPTGQRFALESFRVFEGAESRLSEPWMRVTSAMTIECWNITASEMAERLLRHHSPSLLMGETECAFAALEMACLHHFFSGAPLPQIREFQSRSVDLKKQYRSQTSDYLRQVFSWTLESLQGGCEQEPPPRSEGFHFHVGRTVELHTFLLTDQLDRALGVVLEESNARSREQVQGQTDFYYWVFAGYAVALGRLEQRVSESVYEKLFGQATRVVARWVRHRRDRQWSLDWLHGMGLLLREPETGKRLLYKALKSRRAQGGNQVVGLLAETLARLESGTEKRALLFEACQAYRDWGAEFKVEQLQRALPAEFVSAGTKERDMRAAIEELAQFTSPEDLAREFLRQVQLHAHATRALLIRVSDNVVLSSQSGDEEWASSILSMAVGGRAPRWLDKEALSSFSGDPHLQRHSVCAILVIPVLHRGLVEEALYLEFHADRDLSEEVQSYLTTLSLTWKILSSQAERALQLEQQHKILESVREMRFQERIQGLASEARRNALATFLSVASHDLKSPLASIAIWADQLPAGTEKKNIVAACARANGLISDYLDGMALELGSSIKLDRKPLDLATLVEEEVDFQLESLEPASRATTRLGWDLNSVTIEGDQIRLQQVVANLIGNALKHCPQGTRIQVWTGLEGQNALLRVEDEGPGIELERRSAIFQPFETSSTGDGSGLGLWLARKIVEAHQGTIEYEPCRPGSCFSVRIPAGVQP